MALVSDTCICLRRIEYSETSQILWLFGRQRGPVRVLAKGAHRKTKAGASRFDGGVDLLETGCAVFTDDTARDLATLTEWKLLDGRLELRNSLRALWLGQYAVELISLLIEQHDPHQVLWDRLDQVLREIAGRRREESFLAFELELLREAGYLPELNICVACGTASMDRSAGYFSPTRGGMLCRNCESAWPDRVEIDPRLLRAAAGIARIPRAAGSLPRLPVLTRHQTDPLNRLLGEHTQHVLGRRLKMLRYIRGSRQPAPPAMVSG